MDSFKAKNTGFTLVELVVAITILSIIMLSVFVVYTNIITINNRLEVIRSLQQNARNATETIATDVREKGIDFAYYDGSSTFKTPAYEGSGTTVLAIHGGTRYYPMKESFGSMVLCNDADAENPNIHCFLGMENAAGKRIALTDTSVRIDQLRFFISWDDKTDMTNLSQEGKVLMAFTLGIEHRWGIDAATAKNTTLKIETTISEKAYKKN